MGAQLETGVGGGRHRLSDFWLQDYPAISAEDIEAALEFPGLLSDCRVSEYEAVRSPHSSQTVSWPSFPASSWVRCSMETRAAPVR